MPQGTTRTQPGVTFFSLPPTPSFSSPFFLRLLPSIAGARRFPRLATRLGPLPPLRPADQSRADLRARSDLTNGHILVPFRSNVAPVARGRFSATRGDPRSRAFDAPGRVKNCRSTLDHGRVMFVQNEMRLFAPLRRQRVTGFLFFFLLPAFFSPPLERRKRRRVSRSNATEELRLTVLATLMTR